MASSVSTPTIYLDYHATAPVDHRVAARVYHYMTEEFGNASSTDHAWGDRAETAVKQASKQVADLIGASPREIVWTSGATESLNLAIQGSLLSPLARSGRGVGGEGKPRIGLMPLEHKAVLDTCQALEKRDLAELVYLRVDARGRLDLEHLEQVCAEGLSLLCVMAANNEIGNVYPIQEIGQIAQHNSIPFLCDGSQAVGKIPIQFGEWGITCLAISAHKLYGPKGVGALAVRKGYHLEPLIFGGGQQRGIRPGTLNVPGIAGLGEACRLLQMEMAEDEAKISQLRDRLQALLQAAIPDLAINGDPEHRLAGSLHLSIPGIPNTAMVSRVRDRLALSTGAACASGVEMPSHVLRAIALPKPLQDGALRLSLGKFTTAADVESAAAILVSAAGAIRQILLP